MRQNIPCTGQINTRVEYHVHSTGEGKNKLTRSLKLKEPIESISQFSTLTYSPCNIDTTLKQFPRVHKKPFVCNPVIARSGTTQQVAFLAFFGGQSQEFLTVARGDGVPDL